MARVFYFLRKYLPRDVYLTSEIMIKLIAILLLTAVASVLFFSFTDPSKLPAALLMIPILLTFSFFSITAYILLRVFLSNYAERRKLKSIAILCGITVSLVMLFQSTGGIVWADIILMGLILIVSYLYINKI